MPRSIRESLESQSLSGLVLYCNILLEGRGCPNGSKVAFLRSVARFQGRIPDRRSTARFSTPAAPSGDAGDAGESRTPRLGSLDRPPLAAAWVRRPLHALVT